MLANNFFVPAEITVKISNAVKTSNFYGKLVITDDAIAMTAYHAALDCYGVIDLVSRSLTAESSSLELSLASPTPILITTLTSFGMAKSFL